MLLNPQNSFPNNNATQHNNPQDILNAMAKGTNTNRVPSGSQLPFQQLPQIAPNGTQGMEQYLSPQPQAPNAALQGSQDNSMAELIARMGAHFRNHPTQAQAQQFNSTFMPSPMSEVSRVVRDHFAKRPDSFNRKPSLNGGLGNNPLGVFSRGNSRMRIGSGGVPAAPRMRLG